MPASRTSRTPPPTNDPKRWALLRAGRSETIIQTPIKLYHQLFHVGCHPNNDRSCLVFLTKLELRHGACLREWGGPREDERCKQCDRVVPPYGFVTYTLADDGEISPTSALCKTCHFWAQGTENYNNEHAIAVPQCICPQHEIIRQCAFHSAFLAAPRAKQLVPPGVPRSLGRVCRWHRVDGVWGAPGSPFNELAAAIMAWKERRASVTIASSHRRGHYDITQFETVRSMTGEAEF
ncbi:hypothetical protein B0H13DRAFT_2537603 [Mycena leptocephala]|nr:hypothetical protein B0H13DRAFT_2537603 [Mycena leptocephala]